MPDGSGMGIAHLVDIDYRSVEVGALYDPVTSHVIEVVLEAR